MNAPLDVGQQLDARHTLLGHYFFVMAITFFGVVANLTLVLIFAEGANVAAKSAMGVSVIATTAFSVLAVPSLLRQMMALREDATETIGKTRYGEEIARLPMTFYSGLTVIIVLLLALTQLWVLFVG